MLLDEALRWGQNMAVLVELQSVLRRVGQRVERRGPHVLGSEMMMLMFDHVRRGEVAERRGVLMEIRGKHNCVLASVSTTIPPLEGRS